MLHVMSRYLNLHIFGCFHTCSSVQLVRPKGERNDTLLPFSSGLCFINEPRAVSMQLRGLTGSSRIGQFCIISATWTYRGN